MNLGQRIIRLAKNRVLHGLRGRGARPVDPAREELDQALRNASRRATPPPAGPRSQSPPPRTGPSSATAGPRPAGGAPPPGTAGTRPGTSQGNAAPKPPPAPPPHPYAAEYRLLGLPAGADLSAVRAAWRAQVKASHPDRFAGDPDAQQRAADRLRAINEAYQALQAHLTRAGK